MKRFALGVVFAVASLVAVASAQAQSQTQNPSTLPVVAACTMPGATQALCLSALETHIELLQAQEITPEQLDAAIGRLVVDLASAARGPSPIVGLAIATAANYVSNSDQANSIINVANDVAAGRSIARSLGFVIVVASPN